MIALSFAFKVNTFEFYYNSSSHLYIQMMTKVATTIVAARTPEKILTILVSCAYGSEKTNRREMENEHCHRHDLVERRWRKKVSRELIALVNRRYCSANVLMRYWVNE